MKFELNSLPINSSDEIIIAEIKRVDALVNKSTLTQDDFDQHGKIRSGTLSKRYGSWPKVLALAGIENKFGNSKTFRQQRQRRATDDQILAELNRIAKILNKQWVTREDWKNYSEIGSYSMIEHRFGLFSVALKKAGLKVSPSGNRYTLEEYFENLLNVWTHYGRPPFRDEMNKLPSKIGGGGYVQRFGTWRKALEAFVDRMNQGDPAPKQAGLEVNSDIKPEVVVRKPETIKRQTRDPNENKREIGLALRYKVLSRDKFKCVRCGTSPATDHTCCLHVDHMLPFSKGGKTILENLQVLCERCNLGKGNRHFE